MTSILLLMPHFKLTIRYPFCPDHSHTTLWRSIVSSKFSHCQWRRKRLNFSTLSKLAKQVARQQFSLSFHFKGSYRPFFKTKPLSFQQENFPTLRNSSYNLDKSKHLRPSFHLFRSAGETGNKRREGEAKFQVRLIKKICKVSQLRSKSFCTFGDVLVDVNPTLSSRPRPCQGSFTVLRCFSLCFN